ncbi:hypothetical protein HMPREF0239_04076, partial [Clostridium sp. ATCC BAA-442]
MGRPCGSILADGGAEGKGAVFRFWPGKENRRLNRAGPPLM